MDEEILYVLALKFTNGIGDILAKQLISYCGSAKAVFNMPKGKLMRIPSIGAKMVETVTNSTGVSEAQKCIDACLKYDIRIIPYFDSSFPPKLKLVNDAPLVLFCKGAFINWNKKIVAIVGTRKATEYGKSMTLQIVNDLKSHDAIIVSGLAYGIDIAAHKASLDQNMCTIGVLAGGLDKVYPALHKNVATEMLESGMLVSEHPPGVKPDAHNFPARNRIIAGMSDTLIVVEAAAKGGALISANVAFSYNKEVFAVPGQLGGKYSDGCNLLIRSQKAIIYTSIQDLEYHLNWEVGKEVTKESVVDISKFTIEENLIIKILQEFDQGLQLDELSWKSELSVNKTLTLLLNLEFSGVVQSLPGKQYKLTRLFV